jgi:hypothetical protein
MPRVGRSGRRCHGPPPLRGRRDRAAHRVTLQFPGRRRRRLPRRHLRPGEGRLRGTGAGAHRWRLRPAARRDHLRLAQREGGARGHPGRLRGRRRAPADHDLGGGRPGWRDDDLGADDRGVLDGRGARQAAVGRPQLLARARPDVPLPRGTGHEVVSGNLVLSQRGTTQSAVAHGLRPRARRHGALPGPLRERRADQHRRRMLRQHARPHRRDRSRPRWAAGTGRASSLRRRRRPPPPLGDGPRSRRSRGEGAAAPARSPSRSSPACSC